MSGDEILAKIEAELERLLAVAEKKLAPALAASKALLPDDPCEMVRGSAALVGLAARRQAIRDAIEFIQDAESPEAFLAHARSRERATLISAVTRDRVANDLVNGVDAISERAEVMAWGRMASEASRIIGPHGRMSDKPYPGDEEAAS